MITDSRVACIELGSGIATLFMAEKTNLTNPFIVRTEKTPIAKAVADRKNNGRIPEETQQVALAALQKLVEEAKSNGADTFVIVATAAYRDATNGQEVCHFLKESLGLDSPIEIITPEKESLLGLASASIVSNIAQKNLIAFDMGSGSMQLSGLDHKKRFRFFSQPMGTTFGADLFWKAVRKQPPAVIYPVTPGELETLLGSLEQEVSQRFFSSEQYLQIQDLLQEKDRKVAGIGFTALVAISMKELGLGRVDEATDTHTITPDDIRQLLALLTQPNVKKREAVFQSLTSSSGIWKDPAVPAIALLYTLIKQAGIEEITCSLNKDLVGNGTGILHDFYQRSETGMLASLLNLYSS